MIMCFFYFAGEIAWVVLFSALAEFKSVRHSFYTSAAASFLSFISTCYYYKALARIEKERLVNKLIND